MKKKHVFVLLFLLFANFAQAEDRLFSKYAEKENVSSIYVSKAMFNLMSSFVDVKDLPVDDLKGKIKSMQILRTEDLEEARKMSKEFSSYASKHHEKLMRVKDKKRDLRFYIKKKGEKVSELLLFTQTKNDFSLVLLLGDFTMKEIEEFAEKSKKIF